MRSSGPADRTFHPLAPSARPDHLKDSLLRTLRTAVQPVSGEALAADLGISRAAVWKRIQGLKALGYVIQGEPRRGYVLLAAPDKLLPAEVLDGLNTRLFRGPVYHFETIASTNDLAKELGTHGAPEGTLVVAEAQEAGRGRPTPL